MNLTTRLLAFFAGSVAAVLVGFSAALYLIAQDHLYRQADERLDAALNTLGASVEVGRAGVEWEPNERVIRLPSGPEGVVWVVTDEGGAVVGRSDRPNTDDLLVEAAERFHAPNDVSRRLHWRGEHWQAGQRRFEPDRSAPVGLRPLGPNEGKYPVLVVTAALPLEPTRASLRGLLATLVGTSVGILAVASIAGWFVCRRALRPVRRMAADARAVDPADRNRRLAVPGGKDELTDLGAAFNGLLDRLHGATEQHRRFAGDASHQLRTPLAALLGQLEVALRRERPADDYREALAAAHAQATHLQKIVETLLVLTRAGVEGLPRERFDLAAWLGSHLQSWATHPRHTDFRVITADTPLPLESHPVLLGEVVNVLLDNAGRYSPPGTAITLTLSHSEGSARIAVSDHGPGIAPDDLPQVFTPFFRTTDALRVNRQGVGLGLAIARRLAEALGGHLSVTSRTGEGSRFTVTVPAATGVRGGPALRPGGGGGRTVGGGLIAAPPDAD